MKVVVDGTAEGHTLEEVARNLGAAFRIPGEQALRILRTPNFTVKRGIDAPEADRYVVHLQAIGCMVTAMPDSVEPAKSAAPKGTPRVAGPGEPLRYGWFGKTVWWLVCAFFVVLVLAGLGNKAPIGIAVAIAGLLLLNPLGQRKLLGRLGFKTWKPAAVLAVGLCIGSMAAMGYSLDPELMAKNRKAREQERLAEKKHEWEVAQAEAKKLGFASAAQQQQVQSLGYKTMAEFNEVRKWTPEYFASTCMYGTSKSEYADKCYGKKVVWKAVISDLSAWDGAHLQLLNEDGSIPRKDPTVDSKSLAKLVGSKDIGKVVSFQGVVDEQNSVTPDIEKVKLISLENDTGKASRDARTAQIRKECEDEALGRGIARYVERNGPGSATELEGDFVSCLNNHR